MAIQFSNLASTTLASGVSSTATSVSVTSASSFPTLGSGDYFYATIGAGSGSEIVKVTGISGTTFTVVRGEDGTTAVSHSAGVDVALRVTAGTLEDLRDGGQVYTAGSGLGLSGNEFTNTAPDQTVSISGSGSTTVTGTYPSFTVSSTSYSHPSAHPISFITGLQTALDGKVDDSQVLTNVPSGALFTDTNTVYTHPSAHGISFITGLQAALDGKVDDSQVLTDVPANALFTDTVYTLPFTDNSANWNTAYGWGDHASGGYLTSHQSLSGYATETYVGNQITALVDSSPATMDTLNELAAALGDDPNFATTVSTSIGTKWTQDNTKISQWNTAYGWGNHASAGYYAASNPNGYTNDQTAAEILTAIKTVDGSGSGLDADLLDGQQGSYYRPKADSLYYKPTREAAPYLDLNAATTPGIYRLHSASNHNGHPTGSGYGFNIVLDNSDVHGHILLDRLDGGTMHIRAKAGTTWTTAEWNKVWTSGNDGSGTGLDADLLDGQQGSYYAPASHGHSYLPLTGGTLTGALSGTTATFTSDSNALTIRTASNGQGAEIRFSDQVSATPQFGYLTYFHSDGSSYGSGNAFIFGSSEATTTILADGKLMFKEGLYLKPSSGTGAGTRKDLNWDTAYGWGNHASAGYLTSYTDTNTTYSIQDGELSQNNFTDADHTKLNGIATGANNYTLPFTNNSANWNTAYGWGNHASAGYYAASNPNGYTSNVGDITGVTAGTGLTGGGTSGTPTLNVIGGSGITANADNITVDSTVLRTTGNQTKDAVLNTRNSAVDDETLFAITDSDDTTSVRAKFYTTSTAITKVDDATAPASGVFKVTGAFYATWGEYIPMDDETEIMFECWIKHVSGSDTTGNFYAGGEFYNGAKTSYGNTQRYWGANGDGHDSDTPNPPRWRHIKGVMHGGAIRSQSTTPDAQYVRLLVLANYNAAANASHFCGFRFYRSKKTISSLWLKAHNTTSYNQDSAWQNLEASTAINIIDNAGNITSPATITATGGNSTNWNTAYGWGNHASAGYYAASNPNGYTNDQTAAEILTAIKTVDGSGSGLDADLLDGLQGSRYVANQDGLRYTTDFNTILTSGFYNAQSTPANAPGSYGQLIVAKGVDTGMQIYGGYNNDNLWFRGWASSGATLYPWRKVWHDANDGSGSGLDADLLDGQHGSYYFSAANFPTQTNFENVYNNLSTSTGSGADLNSTFLNDRSGNFDCWSGANFPVSTTHVQGLQVRHSTGTDYGWQLASQYSQPGKMYLRHITNGTFYDWHSMWSSANDGSGSGLDADSVDGIQGASLLRSDAADTFTGTITMGTQLALVANNYGRGVFGLYSSTRYQHVWSMGTAYKTNDSGTSYGNMYGLTYTHSNVGTGTNQSISGLSHQLQHRTNGVLTAAIGSGIWTSGNVTAYSDIAVKTNLVKIPDALEKVCSINGYTYERTDYVKDLEDPEAPDVLRQAGVVAQEVEKILPEVVSGKDGNKAVAYGNMVALMIEAIKELKAEVDDLKAKLEHK